MGMRPGKGKGPYTGSGTGSGSSTASAAWSDLGEFTYADFSFEGLTQSITALALPANAVFYAVRIVPTIAFVNAGATFYNLRVGIAGTQDLYLPDYDLLGLAPGNAVFGFGSLANGHIDSLAGWNILFTAESDISLDAATAGAFEAAVQYAIVP